MEEKAIKQRNPLAIVKSLVVELKTIDWPSRQRTIQLTTIVIGASIIFGLLIGGLDYLLTLGLEAIIALRG
jgi:preprotein translocase SecE subunit